MSKRVTKSFEWVGVFGELVTKSFKPVGVSSERVIKSFERVGISSERVTKSDRKSTRLNSSHANISYAVFCLKKKKETLN